MSLKPNLCPKDCPKRQGGCHATCKDYADKKKEYEAERDRIREAKRAEKAKDCFIVESKRRHKK